ncbi:MAG: hypothetical protein ACTHJN_08390, partial [Ginsengibacter sp.]
IQEKHFLNFDGTNVALECLHDTTPILILKTDFETCLKEEISSDLYDEFFNEAREIIKPIGSQQKGALARYVARKVVENNPDFTPSFITTLIELLKEFIPEQINKEEKANPKIAKP